ncbi:MAG TPA: hypothetical protein VN684_12610 [Terriglobales bacterium]|nr:hypothetical protein [Terriglobales bacterium]
MTNKRPLAVTIISWIYIVVGVLGLVFHLKEYRIQHPFEYDIVWIAIVEIAAIVAGIFMLRGSNWARWLALAWIGFHVGLSIFHPWQELAIHSALFIVIAYFLFNRPSKKYFRNEQIETA